MKIATYTFEGRRHAGIVDAGNRTVTPFEDVDTRVDGALAIIRLAGNGDGVPIANGKAIPLDQIKLEAPIPRPARNVFCVGKNYHDHAREFARSGFDSSVSSADAAPVPSDPIFFSKVPESVIATGDIVRIPGDLSVAIDYETELTVVIGKGGRQISAASALDHVWGYTIINDVTARDIQGRHKQWLLGKSLDTFCPMGPWLVSKDELDGTDTRIRCWVNGEPRQDARTTDLIFDIPCLIETLSAGITLYPGDLIATGTAAGVGIGFTPPKYLKSGDVVRMEVDGIGVLENRFV